MMRPTGVVLIAVYHFVSAAFLACLAIFVAIGGSFLGAMFGAGREGFNGLGLGLVVGLLGAAMVGVFAIVALIAGYGVWSLREWGRIVCIVLAAISILISLPGLLLMGLHFNLFFGGYRVLRIAVNVLIIWYLMQPQIKALFRPRVPVTSM